MEFWGRKKKLKEKGKGREKEEERSEWFLKNGSRFLEELIKDCNGISNPIRMFSSDQILTATDAECYFRFPGYFTWYKAVIEGRPHTFKRFTGLVLTGEGGVYNDIALSARASNHSGFLKLIGCCLEFPFPVVVFENTKYVLNERGNVGSEDGPLLPWNVRLKIAKEIAIAVTYFHTAFPKIIIHRNIKAANVFLDNNWNAKLTDFSCSVTLPEGKSWIKDHVFGTPGYVDPNYSLTGILTEYSDVFSFGIFMLVLLMGRPSIFVGSDGLENLDTKILDYDKDLPERGEPVEFGGDSNNMRPGQMKILDYVKDLRERGEPVEFGGDSNNMRPGQMKMFLELALRCCEDRNEDRPNMISVAKEIKIIERSLDCQT